MENVICPNCGFQFPLDKSRDFCFCLKCGTKIEVPKYEEIKPEVQKVKPTEQPEVKNKTPKNEPKSKVDSALEEVEFYYDTSFNKKEYVDTENQPTYYLKAQDLLIDLSTEFETDWRIWWEVSKPMSMLDEVGFRPANYRERKNEYEKKNNNIFNNDIYGCLFCHSLKLYCKCR